LIKNIILISLVLLLSSCSKEEGCTNENACNFNSTAIEDDGNCYDCFENDCSKYPINVYDCLGECIIDLNNDGTCDNLEKIFVATQGFDQINILTSIGGEINEDEEIISVNLNENIMDIPHFIEIDKVNKYWFVTLMNSGNVLMYNLETNEKLSEITVNEMPALMVHDPILQRLYISRMMAMDGMGGSSSNKIQVLDYSSGILYDLAEINLPAPAPHGLDLSDDGLFLFVASNTTDWIYKIDVETQIITNEVFLPSPENPLGPYEINYLKPIQLRYFNHNIFISCSAGKFYNGETTEDIPGKIIVLNADDLSFITQYEFDWNSSPWHLTIDENSSDIFVALSGDIGYAGTAGVASLSFSNDQLFLNWETTGNEFLLCHGISISTISEQIYVTSRGNGKLHLVDRNSGELLQSIVINSLQQGMAGAMLGGIAIYGL
jgi:hypothetical protein